MITVYVTYWGFSVLSSEGPFFVLRLHCHWTCSCGCDSVFRNIPYSVPEGCLREHFRDRVPYSVFSTVKCNGQSAEAEIKLVPCLTMDSSRVLRAGNLKVYVQLGLAVGPRFRCPSKIFVLAHST